MTSFAVSIWAFEKTGSALILSLSTISIMLPRIFIYLLAGPLVDKLNKKYIMLLMDLLSGIITGILLLLLYMSKLEIWHIYLLNMLNGILNCIQNLASDVAISQIVPKHYYTRASGLHSFSDGINRLIPPILAAVLLGIFGMSLVVLIDFITMAAACITLALFVRIPFIKIRSTVKTGEITYFKEIVSGFSIIRKNNILWTFILFFSFVDFVSGITYANLITPMILARSGNNAGILSFVRGGMGIGMIVGGFITSLIKIPESKNRLKIIFFCCLSSFVGGDLLLGISSNPVLWIIGGFLGNVFTPMAMANITYIWRTKVPIDVQGRVFSCRRSMSNVSMIIGIFLGGFLADKIFEPFLMNNETFLAKIFGSEKGSGMGLMFTITGIIGIIINVLGLANRRIKQYGR
jgi:MFS family permease